MVTTINKPRRTADGEWRVSVTVDGRHAPARDYFATDRDDAVQTREAMIQEARSNGENVTNNPTGQGADRYPMPCDCGPRVYCDVCEMPNPNTTTTGPTP